MGQGIGQTTLTFPDSPQSGRPAPGTNTASTTVTGLTAFTDTDTVQAWLMADSTADHDALAHALVPVRLRVRAPITGTGFTIDAVSEHRLRGAFKVRYAFTS